MDTFYEVHLLLSEGQPFQAATRPHAAAAYAQSHPMSMFSSPYDLSLLSLLVVSLLTAALLSLSLSLSLSCLLSLSLSVVSLFPLSLSLSLHRSSQLAFCRAALASLSRPSPPLPWLTLSSLNDRFSR